MQQMKAGTGNDPRLEEIQDELRRLRKKAKSDPRQAAIKVSHATTDRQAGARKAVNNNINSN
jgi:hypothetical protein